MNALGKHLILELKDCDAILLDNLDFIRESMLHAASSTGATVIGDTFHKFSPQGVTGVLAIAESHLCIHTWPEYEYAAADIFTCGESFDPNDAADVIIERLKSKTPSKTELIRGILPHLTEIPTY